MKFHARLARSSSTKEILSNSEDHNMSYKSAVSLISEYLLMLQKLYQSKPQDGAMLPTTHYIHSSDVNNNEEIEIDKERNSVKSIFLFGGVPSPDTWSRYCLNSREWQQRECPSEERYGACSASLGRHVYIIGGRTADEYHNTVDCVTSAGDDFTNITPHMNKARYGAAAITITGALYVIGGCDGSRVLNSVERYDQSTNRWSFVTSMKQHRFWPAACSANGNIYVFGGRNETEHLKSVEKYDPVTGQWSHVTPMTSARCGCSAITFHNFIYVIGGSNGEETVSSVIRYDVINDVWSDVTSMHSPRAFFGCCLVQYKIFVFGGYGRDLPQKSVEFLNVKDEKWRKEDNLPFAIAEQACVAV